MNNIIERIKQGEKGLYSVIMKEYWGSLYWTLFCIVGNKEDTEDVVMITFEKAYENLDNWAPDYLFQTWLFTIGKNTAVDFLRRKQFRLGNFIDTDEVEYQFHSHHRSPDQICEERDWLEKVSGKINLLPEKCKKVLELKTKDISDNDIAKMMGMKPVAVRCLLHRARNQLKQLVL